MQLANGLGRSESGLKPVHDGEVKAGFLKFERNGTMFSFRKSTLLWILTTSATKVSTDRLHRFIDHGEQGQKTSEAHIRIGDFIRINQQNEISICSVIRFKFRNYKYKFKNSFCPISHKDDVKDGAKGGQGVDMLVDFYKIIDSALRKTEEVAVYVDIDSYIDHVQTKRDNFTQEYIVL